MTQTLPRVIADLQISLASAVSVGQTTATLSTSEDGDEVALPSGLYAFTIDGDNSAKEFITCQLSGTALTVVQSITVQGVATSGFANYHRVGAIVTITDWVVLGRQNNLLDGTTGFDAGFPIKYDAQPILSDPLAIPTVQYVIDTASGTPVSINAIVVEGDAGETISSGEWVYYDTATGKWLKTDADVTAKCLGVQIGKARGAGTNNNPIVGGIFIEGLETVGTYVAGTTYYIGNTAGALSTSAGTNSVVVGVGDANGDLVLRKATPSQTDAMVGGGALGTPTGVNKFLTLQTAPQVLIYNANDTWTKDSGLVRIRVQLWGAGGSGGVAANGEGGGGGGGGAYVEKWFEAASLGGTEAIVVGAGGIAQTASAAGNPGNNSTFGASGTLVTAYGGGAGGGGAASAGGGGGGGTFSVGANGSGANGGNGGSPIQTTTWGIGGVANTNGQPNSMGGGGAGGGGATPGAGASSTYGGAGGGGGDTASNTTGIGGNSIFGGAGGGGGAGATAGASGGTSINGGNGGAGAFDANNATAGSVPGGGGGGSETGNSGAGGAGRVIVTEYYI